MSRNRSRGFMFQVKCSDSKELQRLATLIGGSNRLRFVGFRRIIVSGIADRVRGCLYFDVQKDVSVVMAMLRSKAFYGFLISPLYKTRPSDTFELVFCGSDVDETDIPFSVGLFPLGQGHRVY